MARQSKAFDLAWGSLSGTDAESGWRAIAVGPAGSVAIHAGRRFPGNEEALLVSFAGASVPPAEKLPDGLGFAVERADPYRDGAAWLALTRKATGSPELFSAMACDVAGALDAAVADGADQPRLLRVVLGRVKAWQEFMRKGAQALSPEAEIGLIGELLVLAAIIDAGVAPSEAVEAWKGPQDGVQDFELGTGAVEVKTTIATVGFAAEIGSLDQLDDSVRQPLFVAGVKLRQLATGTNLPGIVAATRIKVALDAEATRLLADRFIAARYLDSDAGLYTRRFDPVGMRLVEVTPAFPRLLHATVPQGVTRAIYGIDFDKAGGPAWDLVSALKKLGVI
jgi:Putative  PD-(D/E)XK family member, (DUF4420)